MGNGHQGRYRSGRRCALGQIGAQGKRCDAAPCECAAFAGDTAAVGDHQGARVEGRAHDGLPFRRIGGGVVDVATMDRGDDRYTEVLASPECVGSRDGVVGVDHVELEPLVQPDQRATQRPRRPAAPFPVAAGPRRREEAHVRDRDPVELGMPGLGEQSAQFTQRLAGTCSQRGHRWDRPVQHEHLYLRSSRSGGDSLTVGPRAEHRVVCARVELRHDRDLHRRSARCDHAASSRVT